MLRPIWNTLPGSIGTISAGSSTLITLDATNTSAIELISKSLPPGLKLNSSTQTITGICQDLGIDKTYEFVLRASNTTGVNNSKVIQDRTFNITVTSDARPILLDPEGTLNLVNASENYVLNKSTVSYQFTASSTAIPAGQTLKFYIEEGRGQLPPGLKITPDGLLYGTIDDDLDLDYTAVQGTYDRDYYDMNPYDYSSNIEPARGVVTVAQGKINTTSVIYGGNGYLLDPAVIIGGSINTITIVNKGAGYTEAPSVVFGLSPVTGGITATGYAVMEDDYVTSSIFSSITDNGLSNSTVDQVIDGGDAVVVPSNIIDGGVGNPLQTVVSGKRVAGIVITNYGTGYTTAPNIYFKGQNTGSGAEATCTLRTGSGAELAARVSSGSLVALDIINTGSGYSVPPIISFGLPTAGSKIISKVYKFALTVSNGEEVDTKNYTILVKSEDSLRVDTTFISSDTFDFDTSKTYVQAPIWLSPSKLPVIKGDNNFIYNLEVFDPTPNIGKVYFSLMDVNFDGTESSFGPSNEIKNAVAYTITAIELTRPAKITLAQSQVFRDGDRIKLTNITGTTQLNNGIFYVKVIDGFNYSLYSDRLLINAIDALLYNPFTGFGEARFLSTYLNLDSVGGEINGFIPYQPAITRLYNFTIKAVRVIDNAEVASVFKQFELTVKGNIEGEITFTSPALLGTLQPNEQSLYEVVASSTIPSGSIVYSLIPGYGRTSIVNYIELDFVEQNGNVFVEGYGLNPSITFEKGQTYKINVSLSTFTMSFKNFDNSYFNIGVRHSSGAVEQAAQEKSSGYYIFTPPYNDSTSLRIVYTNIKRDGLIMSLKKYNSNTKLWQEEVLPAVFDEYEANTYFESTLYDKTLVVGNGLTTDDDKWVRTPNGNTAYALFLDRTKVQLQIKKYNPSTFVWDLQNITTTKPSNPANGAMWLDLDESNYGLLEFRYVGLRGVWTPFKPTLVSAIPNNSVGVNGNYFVFNDAGTLKVLRKINATWKVLQRLPAGVKAAYDPNVFFTTHYRNEPTTNLQYDVWFKYTSIYNGKHAEIYSNLKSLDSLPTELSISLSGDIIGRISPNTASTYKSFYTSNRLYLANDVVTVDNNLYLCVNQYRSAGDWLGESANWQPYFFLKRVVTSIDVNIYSSSKFSIAGNDGTDNTTIDKLFRFRVRARDTQNVGFIDKDFNIEYIASSSITLTNVYLQPFLSKENRDNYFNFITDPIVFPQDSIYRSEDSAFGVQRIPKMLLLGGIESTTAERYASAVQRNYYDRPLYFGDVKVAIAKNGNNVEYEVIYVEINDPYEIGNFSVSESIYLGFDYDPLTADYSKLRADDSSILVPSIDILSTENVFEGTSSTILTDPVTIGLDTIYPSSITLMQKGLANVSSQKTESVLIIPVYDGPYIAGEPQGWGTINPVDTVTVTEDWGLVNERVAIIDDFLSVIEPLSKDEKYRPLWMNTSQDGTGNIVGYVKAVPICYLKPGQSAKVLQLIQKSNFDFKTLNFTIDRIIIQNPQGETGDKYIKFINREII